MDRKKKPHNKKAPPRYEPVPPVETRSILRSPWFFSFLSLLVLIITLSIRKIANYDVGFHLASGRWVIENLAFPYKDIFTYTVTANEYIDVLWLYQVLFYLTQSLAGYAGLTVLNSIMIVVVFYLMFKRMNLAGTPFYISLAMLAAAVFAMQIRFSYRPEIVTWIFMLLILYILDKYTLSGKKKLFWLPVIMLFWVNMHGLFIIGLIIIAAYAASVYYHTGKLDINLLKWLGLSIAVIFINPYFAEGAFFPLYLFTRLEAGNIFKDTISELQSPLSMSGSVGTDLYIYYAVVIISTTLFVITYKNRKMHQYILFAAFLFISYRAFRNIPIFIIYALNISALSLTDIVKQNSIKASFAKFSGKKKLISIAVSILILFTVPRIITGAFYWKYNSRLVFGLGLDYVALPEKAADFMNERRISGKIINVLEYGGWLEWKLRQPVFIDGRLEVMRELFYSEYINGLKTNGLPLLLGRYDPGVIFNEVGNYVWNLELKKRPEWKLVYYDNTSCVFIKNSKTDTDMFDFLSGARNEGIDASVFDDSQKLKLIKDSRIYSSADWVSGFYSHQYMPVELMKMGNFAFDFDRVDAAELFYLEFLHRSNGLTDEINYYDVFNNLAAVYTIQKKYPLAVLCYENCMKTKPLDQSIRVKITELRNLIK